MIHCCLTHTDCRIFLMQKRKKNESMLYILKQKKKRLGVAVEHYQSVVTIKNERQKIRGHRFVYII